MSANMANSAIYPLGVDKWVVSWTQAFAMRICVVAPPGECLRVKADMVLFAGKTEWSVSERIRGVRKDVLKKSTLPLPLPLFRDVNKARGVKAKARDMQSQGHRPKAKAKNANVNRRQNATVNPSILSHFAIL